MGAYFPARWQPQQAGSASLVNAHMLSELDAGAMDAGAFAQRWGSSFGFEQGKSAAHPLDSFKANRLQPRNLELQPADRGSTGSHGLPLPQSDFPCADDASAYPFTAILTTGSALDSEPFYNHLLELSRAQTAQLRYSPLHHKTGQSTGQMHGLCRPDLRLPTALLVGTPAPPSSAQAYSSAIIREPDACSRNPKAAPHGASPLPSSPMPLFPHQDGSKASAPASLGAKQKKIFYCPFPACGKCFYSKNYLQGQWVNYVYRLFAFLTP